MILHPHFSISSKAASRWFALVIGSLTLASALTQVLRYTVFGSQFRWWMAIVDLNREQNLPSYYQGIAIFSAAVLLGMIAIQKWSDRAAFRVQWVALAGLFLYLSMDELCSLHEQMGAIVEKAAGGKLTGVWHYAWVLPAIALVVGIGSFFIRFLVHLPGPTRLRFIAAGSVYVTGALVLEMAGAWCDQTYGSNTLACQLLANLEEFLEMLGIALFVVAVIHYVETFMPPLSVSISAGQVGEEIRARAPIADVVPGSPLPKVAARGSLRDRIPTYARTD